MNLSTKVTQLNRVGKGLESKLKRLGIETVQDLLFYFPFRYEDYSQLMPIKDLEEGMEVTVKGKIEIIANKRSPRKRKIITEAVVVDDTERVRVVWFGQPFIKKNLKVGDTVYLSGKVKSDMFGVQMVGPAYEKDRNTSLKGGGHPPSPPQGGTTHTARIVPMYPLTSGVTQKQLRFLMSQIIEVGSKVEEWVPEEILESVDLVPLSEAIRGIHFPEDDIDLKQAEQRLKFGEVFTLQLRAEIIRQSVKSSVAPNIEFKEKETQEFVASLPFELTKDQKVSAWEMLKDMELGSPMNRLLEGDVGSGKTVVAGLVMYNAVLNNYQAVIMAPTEVLASQHFESLKKLFEDKVSVGLLTRTKRIINRDNIEISRDKSNNKVSQSISTYIHLSKKDIINKIKEGELQIIVGTHALLTDDVEFKDLGLVVVDEQHRFGVEQRKKIKEKSGNKKTTPHFLSMTATPIPRSFALTLYGDLDLSIIKEMPKGRKPVKTRVVDPHNREKAYDFIREQIRQGRQVFVICPLIEAKNSEGAGRDLPVQSVSDKKSVLAEYEKLSKNIFPDLKIGFLHGKMKSKEKDETMNKFAKGEIDILVSTSVVEVGVNIPNASVMMIEGAERFGLAQLHQFRGRVGRAEHQSYCFLFTDSDTQKVKERLAFFESTTDGFKVAEYDLEKRGPGQVYGLEQSGMSQMRFAKYQDKELTKKARDIARGIDFEKYPELRKRVEKWEERVHLE